MCMFITGEINEMHQKLKNRYVMVFKENAV